MHVLDLHAKLLASPRRMPRILTVLTRRRRRTTRIANCAATVTRFTLRNTHPVTNAVNAIITTNTRKGKNIKTGGALGKEAAALAAAEEAAAAAAAAAVVVGGVMVVVAEAVAEASATAGAAAKHVV